MLVFFVLALHLTPSLQQSIIGTVLQSHEASLYKSVEFYTFKGVPELVKLGNDEKREAFHYQQTIVIRDSRKEDDKVRRCELIETYDGDLIKDIYNTLTLLFNFKVQEVTMNKIFNLMEDCDSVDECSTNNNDDGENFYMEVEGKSSEEKKKDPERNPIINGIFPGTKWCGFGDIASGYHDLGGIRNVDRCCRAHDFCPLKVFGKDEKFNLPNKAKYTMSHCFCDEAFHACLKKDNGFAAKIIGNLYFSLVHPKCIRGVPENLNETMRFIEGLEKW